LHRHGDVPSDGPSVQRPGILLLVDEIWGEYGGTEQHLMFLQRRLPQDRLRIHFAAFNGLRGTAPKPFPINPLELGRGCRRGLFGTVQRIRRLAHLIDSRQIDLVHAFSPVAEIAAMVATKLAQRGRVLGVRRNLGYQHSWATRWRSRIVRLLGADYVANCEAAADSAAAMEWIPQRKICIIRNPVVEERVESGLRDPLPRSSLGIAEDEQVVAIVATVRPIKDHDTFIRAARLVADRQPRTRFLIVGHEYDEPTKRLKTLTRELGLEDRVTWVGPLPNPIAVLPNCQVGVLSSLSEAFSNALLEYAAAGLPAVATDVGGAREVVEDGRTGFVVPPRSPELMAEKICRLLDDPMLRAALGNNARQRAESLFSEQRVIEQYLELYDRLIPKRAAAETASPSPETTRVS